MRRIYLILCVVFPIAMHVFGQETSSNPTKERYALTQKKYTFTVQPLQLFNSGLRFDVEMRLGDGPGWLQFGPAIYYEKRESYTNYFFYGKRLYHGYGWYNDIWGGFREPFSELRGGGLDVNYKRYLNARRSFYFATGLSYTLFDIKYRGWNWNDYIEDGLEYHGYEFGYNNQYINRLGINTFWGFQVPTRRAFIFDMFWGLAYRHSFFDEDKPAFNEHMYSYGWSGPVFLFGLKFGFGR